MTFLDFGLVKRFDAAEVDLFEHLIRTMVLEPDLEAYRKVLERAGFVRPDAAVDNQRLADYAGFYYDYVRDDKVATLTAEYASATAHRFLPGSGDFNDVMKCSNLPPTFVVLQRINLGLFAILGRLRATANWRRIAEEMWPMTDGPPSSELGEAEHEWWAARHGGTVAASS